MVQIIDGTSMKLVPKLEYDDATASTNNSNARNWAEKFNYEYNDATAYASNSNCDSTNC